MVGSRKASAKVPKPRSGSALAVVIGAGRMGADIALAFTIQGWNCEVVETNPSVRKQAASYWRRELGRLKMANHGKRIKLHAAIDDAAWSDADIVIEAVFEDIKLKHALLEDIEPRVRRNTLIVTNTSSLRISDVTSALKFPGRSAGLHFMIPAHVMLAVEITRGNRTSPGTMAKLVSLMKKMGKVPIVINRDVTGMVINRIQHAMYREIYHLIDSGVATAETIDLAVRFGFGFRYQILGPVVSRDIHGLPVHLAASRQIYPTLHNGKAPSRTLHQLVKVGKLGAKTGQGFYRWDPKTVDARLTHFSRLLEEALGRLKRRNAPTEF